MLALLLGGRLLLCTALPHDVSSSMLEHRCTAQPFRPPPLTLTLPAPLPPSSLQTHAHTARGSSADGEGDFFFDEAEVMAGVDADTRAAMMAARMQGLAADGEAGEGAAVCLRERGCTDVWAMRWLRWDGRVR